MKNINHFTFIVPIEITLKGAVTACTIVRRYILQNYIEVQLNSIKEDSWLLE